ncbi:DUF2332 domain-containing protein [Paenibacillus glycinis]|uniref:DUF2332 family protein n=1 Tax=Paenibacillus glycinis TaxID=2697035 RepID=A0ABW9XUM9_9BACL|nr:DUF2332 domain-containing protein [Paenibacillus glycinis]NBD26359.1 DUF2332 family protein [Paenibacillus glycinis]
MHPLSDVFRRYAVYHFRTSSPLYECLSLAAADDHGLLELAAQAGPGQPQPNMLSGAVHYLLLRGVDHPLRHFYPSLTSNPGDPALAFALFKDFCRAYRDALLPLLRGNRVQTNEVNRCAYLYPAFCRIYRQTGRPLALIEIGASAGLQLLWDQYSYAYGTGEVYGGASAALHLSSEPRGGIVPAFLRQLPPIADRVGIALHVVDLQREDDYAWLQALVWPEHRERRLNLEKAAGCLKRRPPRLIEGDAVGLFAGTAAAMPEDAALGKEKSGRQI